MKRRFYLFFSATLIALFIHLCAVFPLEILTISASAQDQLSENIIEQIEKLDLSALEEYIRSLNGFDDTSIVERIFAYIRGDGFAIDDLWTGIKSVFFSNVSALLPIFACITAIALLSGILSGVSSGTSGNTVTKVIHTICYATALIPLLSILTRCFSQTVSTIEEMQRQMQLLFPIMLTLMAASGGTLSVQVAQPAVAFLSATIVAVIKNVILPFTSIVIVLSIADKLSNDLKISKFGGFFKGINKWIIGICVSVFSLFFSVQGIVASTYDGIVRRMAKYAIGNGVPIVGGFLSGGLDLAIAGSILIKNSLGSLGIVLMFSALVEPVFMLIATSLLLRFTSAITQPFGDSKISDFLGETASNLNYCTACILLTGFMYFLSMIILVVSTEALI